MWVLLALTAAVAITVGVGYSSFVRSEWLPALLLWASAVFMLATWLGAARRLIDVGPALVIDNDGLTDRSGLSSVGFVPWADVTGPISSILATAAISSCG
jgi:hypothetical protein